MLTQERLREVLSYDSQTGKFTWIKRKSANAGPGDKAGSLHKFGYHKIRVDGKVYMAHRLAWLYVTSALPAQFIDHVNGVKNDNRFANLRDVPLTENQHNRRGPVKSSKTGFLGVDVCRRDGRFRARIMANGKKYHIGDFNTPEEASAAYMAFKKRLHPTAPICAGITT